MKRKMSYIGCVVVYWMCISTLYATSFPLSPQQVMVKASSGIGQQLAPGDTLLLQAGTWHHLQLKNIHGTPQQPITIINDGGLVSIKSQHYYGISLVNCKYIHLTGSGDQNHAYGIRISQINGGAIGGSKGTTDLEIDHIAIDSVSGVGMMIKTDATCTDFQRHQFTQRNTHLHHNKISHTGLEGLYIGSSNYPGRKITCNGTQVTVLDPLLEYVEIHHNILENTGWDAIQASSAKGVDIHHNQIYHDSKLLKPNQMCGIILGAGSEGRIRNNLIRDGNGNGINSFAAGNISIFNNIIVNPGQWTSNKIGRHGIYVNDKLATSVQVSNFICNNLVINPPCEAIHLESKIWGDKTTVINNNVLIHPGCYSQYSLQNIGHKAYISASYNKASTNNNFQHLELESALFKDTINDDFSPQESSTLIDAGAMGFQNLILTDYFGQPRISGDRIDIGPVEFQVPQGEKDITTLNEWIINPVKNKELIFQQLAPTQSPCTVILYNSLGKEIIRKEITHTDAYNNVPLPTSLPAGMYILHLQRGESYQKAQLIIL